jgi:hypothetical protein
LGDRINEYHLAFVELFGIEFQFHAVYPAGSTLTCNGLRIPGVKYTVPETPAKSHPARMSVGPAVAHLLLEMAAGIAMHTPHRSATHYSNKYQQL